MLQTGRALNGSGSCQRSIRAESPALRQTTLLAARGNIIFDNGVMFIISTRVGPSSIHGNGVFACEQVPAGAAIWRFHPPFDQILSDDDVATLPEIGRDFVAIYAYRSKDLAGTLVLCGDHARFLNHSDDPNTEELPFVSIARRPIAAGDEITCDYGAFCTDWSGF
jgi:uncharacterized protein